MHITQILITVLALLGILIVAVLAIVPTVMNIPLPEHVVRDHKPEHKDDVHLAA
ncbi:hypothetical protein [Microlunatus elymi]|uniref:hypothetical protein n=1 Tax=Microlunatus elymi TaxID=2596828 RepID=UPI00143D2BFE|nr:hypothetical protein [Microlunatus elymi]